MIFLHIFYQIRIFAPLTPARTTGHATWDILRKITLVFAQLTSEVKTAKVIKSIVIILIQPCIYQELYVSMDESNVCQNCLIT